MASNQYFRLTVAVLIVVLETTLGFAADVHQPEALPRTIADIHALFASHAPDRQRLSALQAVMKAPEPQTDDKKDLARHYRQRAGAAEEMAAESVALAAMEKVVSFGGAEDLDWDKGYLADLQARMGNVPAAINANWERLRGSRMINICGYQRLVDLYVQVDLAEAERLQQINEGNLIEQQRKGGKQRGMHRYRSCIESGRASILAARGKPVQAEAALRKVIEELENGQLTAKMRADKDAAKNHVPEQEMRWIEQAGGRLALLLAQQGRLQEAESIERDYLRRAVLRTGGYTSGVASTLVSLATILAQQGRYIEAEQLDRLAIQILDTIHAPLDSMQGAEARKSLASALVAQGRYADALIQYESLRQGFARAPAILQRLAGGGINFAIASIKTGAPDTALAYLHDLIPLSQQWLGGNHLDTMELVGVKAMALSVKGDKKAALEEYRSALPVLLNAAISEGDEPSPLRIQRLKLILESYLDLLGEIRGKALENVAGINAGAEAFRLVDALRSQSTQGAVAASAVRAAANDPAIGKEMRKEQDLTQEMVALHRILRDLMGAPAAQQLPKVIAEIKTRIEAIKRERFTLQADIEKRFPVYANLIRPQPPSLAETRAVLKPGEALINIFTTETGTYLWAFKKDGPVAFASAKLNRAELARRVRALRKSLDPGDVDLTTGIPEFDLDTAYRLYVELLVPIASGWQGAAHLLVATNGALSQLPLALLPTAKVPLKPDAKLPYAQFKDVPWLIRQAAFTQLPSVNALLALRKLPAANAQRSQFIGFGDPQFAAAQVQSASAPGLRNLVITRSSQADVEQSKPLDWMDYSRIPSLPDTRDEILELARALNADLGNDVFLGSQASRANVMKLDLSKRRVVAFATHGLLPDDIPGVSEPSLALANPGAGKHGLLTLEDILSLKLDADWVVLSACNTAAGDGQGADALSGLGRGFFYAGSRALLVTHWPVESVSARLLVIGIFERQASDAKLSRAEALRQSMLALMQRKSASPNFAYAHPLFWAPYALVGEGGI